jgi:hypothetical protein
MEERDHSSILIWMQSECGLGSYAKKTGGKTAALILGGGSPKNFLLQTEPHIQEVLGLKKPDTTNLFRSRTPRGYRGIEWSHTLPKRSVGEDRSNHAGAYAGLLLGCIGLLPRSLLMCTAQQNSATETIVDEPEGNRRAIAKSVSRLRISENRERRNGARYRRNL